MGLFNQMGMYGADEYEDYFLAALLTGDPLLMIGTHGCGKNFMFERMAETMKVNAQIYDASKAMFEDILGFPDMKALMADDSKDRKIKYLSTPMSILDKDFVLVDEISRAHVQMQNKWLEVIRSRQVMGVKAPNLRWVWAAMNPLSYEGAVPLDEALAGRFAWIITMPEIHNMDDADAIQVAMNSNGDDALALDTWGGHKSIETTLPTTKLFEILEAAGKLYAQVAEDYSHAISSYCVRLMKTLSSKSKVFLDGRRVGMILRNITSLIAIKKAKGDPIALETLVLDVLLKSMPNPATGKDISPTDLLAAHNLSKSALYMKKDANYLVTVEKDWSKKFSIAVEHIKEINPMLLNEVIGVIAREDENAPICAVIAPMVLKYARMFDLEAITAVCDRMAKMTGKGKFDFTLDRTSVLAYEDFQEAMREARGSAAGVIAMRTASHMISQRAKQRTNLDDFVSLYRKTKDRVTHAISVMKPAYETLTKLIQEMPNEQLGGADTTEAES